MTASAAEETIVIVEDEEDICDTLREVFEDEGYNVWVAHDGRQALALLRSLPHKPCVIILDLIMPVMDGNQLYAELQQDPQLKDVPVVITTSDPSRAPSDVFILPKPVRLAMLLAAVRKHC